MTSSSENLLSAAATRSVLELPGTPKAGRPAIDHTGAAPVRAFRFEVLLPTVVRAARRLGPAISFTLYLSQAEFGDGDLVRERARAALREIGIDERDRPYWLEAPLVERALLERLRRSVGADAQAIMNPRYAKRSAYERYRTVVLDGLAYRWQEFMGGRIVNIAPEAGQWPWPLVPVAAPPGR